MPWSATGAAVVPVVPRVSNDWETDGAVVVTAANCSSVSRGNPSLCTSLLGLAATALGRLATGDASGREVGAGSIVSTTASNIERNGVSRLPATSVTPAVRGPGVESNTLGFASGRWEPARFTPARKASGGPLRPCARSAV